MEIPARFVWGCNFSIRRQLLIKCKGFHPDGMPGNLLRFRGDGETPVSNYVEESDYKTLYNPMASVHHLVSSERMTEKYLNHRAYLQGISDSYTHIRRSRGVTLNDGIVYSIKNMGSLLKNVGKPIKGDMQKSYRNGYLYHREEVRKDRKLLDWVLKEDYLVANPNEF
jgi:hypothetical protein